MPTRPSQELNLGLQQTRLVLYQLSLGGRPLAMVPKGSGKGQNWALVCGGQMEQESRSRMV